MPQIQESYLTHLNLDLVLLVQNSKNTLLVLGSKNISRIIGLMLTFKSSKNL